MTAPFTRLGPDIFGHIVDLVGDAGELVGVCRSLCEFVSELRSPAHAVLGAVLCFHRHESLAPARMVESLAARLRFSLPSLPMPRRGTLDDGGDVIVPERCRHIRIIWKFLALRAFDPHLPFIRAVATCGDMVLESGTATIDRSATVAALASSAEEQFYGPVAADPEDDGHFIADRHHGHHILRAMCLSELHPSFNRHTGRSLGPYRGPFEEEKEETTLSLLDGDVLHSFLHRDALASQPAPAARDSYRDDELRQCVESAASEEHTAFGGGDDTALLAARETNFVPTNPASDVFTDPLQDAPPSRAHGSAVFMAALAAAEGPIPEALPAAFAAVPADVELDADPDAAFGGPVVAGWPAAATGIGVAELAELADPGIGVAELADLADPGIEIDELGPAIAGLADPGIEIDELGPAIAGLVAAGPPPPEAAGPFLTWPPAPVIADADDTTWVICPCGLGPVPPYAEKFPLVCPCGSGPLTIPGTDEKMPLPADMKSIVDGIVADWRSRHDRLSASRRHRPASVDEAGIHGYQMSAARAPAPAIWGADEDLLTVLERHCNSRACCRQAFLTEAPDAPPIDAPPVDAPAVDTPAVDASAVDSVTL